MTLSDRIAAGDTSQVMNLRQFLYDNFGWDIYEWNEHDIRF
jgi:hypothetical protein